MRLSHARWSFLFLALVLASCENSTQAPTAPHPSLSTVGSSACPSHATFVVSDEATLVNALATAQPNDTIALSGVIELAQTGGLFVYTNNLTFTCAQPGAALSVAPASASWLFVVLGKHVTIERLTLDASNAASGAVVAFNGVEAPFTGFAEDVRLIGNHIICGDPNTEDCISIRSAAGGLDRVTISDNTFEHTVNNSTIALFTVNHVRLERNTIPNGSAWGMLLVGVRDVDVVQNTIEGGSRLFGFVVFSSGEDIRLVGNRFDDTSVHIESDPGTLIQRVQISQNTFEVKNQLAVLLVGVDDARVEKNTFAGILDVGDYGDPVIFITVTHGRITDNSGECGDACVFGAGGSPGLVLARNQFQTAGSSAGFLLQENTDGDSVVGNTIVTTKPSFVPGFGGIRIRDGANAVVTDNIIAGPWANSLALTDVTTADVERNSLQGASRFGIGITTEESVRPISLMGSLFRANRVSGAGMAGIFVQLACNNSFVGNNLQGNAGDVGLVFDNTTGANTFTGNANLVADNGAFDCDGNGMNDPNIISGPGNARRGVQLSGVASGANPQHRIYGVLLK